MLSDLPPKGILKPEKGTSKGAGEDGQVTHLIWQLLGVERCQAAGGSVGKHHPVNTAAPLRSSWPGSEEGPNEEGRGADSEETASMAQWVSVDLGTRRSRFDSRSGHRPGLRARSPVGGVQEAADL